MSNCKSLLIPGDFPPVVSGIATYFYEIWHHFPPENNFILAAWDRDCKNFDLQAELKIIRKHIPTGNSTQAKLFKGILHTLFAILLHLKHHFSVIHCGQVLSSGVTGWVMKKLFKLPYVVYVYGSETYRFGHNRLLSQAIKSFLLNAYKIIPNSHFTKDEFLSFGIPEEKFEVITPGVDTLRFRPAQKSADLIEKYKLQEKFVLLTVARLDERKGHDRVIEAVATLKPHFPNLIYLIVGKGREERRLRKLANSLGISREIIFCGYISDTDLPRYYNLCDIFILLNRQSTKETRLKGDYEGFGIVFLEASACSKPVIAGNYGGIQDAVEDRKSGFIIDGINPVEIERTLTDLIINHQLRKKIGEYGLQRVRQQFDWAILSARIKPYLCEN